MNLVNLPFQISDSIGQVSLYITDIQGTSGAPFVTVSWILGVPGEIVWKHCYDGLVKKECRRAALFNEFMIFSRNT